MELSQSTETFSIETERLSIIPMTLDLAKRVSALSLDEDNRLFLPDEVYETPEAARTAIADMIKDYANPRGPLEYAVHLKGGAYIGHVLLLRLYDEWEIGYHIGTAYTGNGYASEAVSAFVPSIAKIITARIVIGVCRADNTKSRRVLEKSGFRFESESYAEWYGERHLSVMYKREILEI